MNLVDLTCTDFVAETSSNSPAPGGGSVSALAGSLGAALAQMVIRLSDGKKAFLALPETIQNELREKLGILEKKQAELLQLVDDDTDAFNGFMAALALPKSTEAEKAKRTQAMQDGLIVAMNVPLKTAETCLAVLHTLKSIAQYGNKNAASDVGVAALMSEAGLSGAVLNVKINLGGLQDTVKKAEYTKKCDKLLSDARQLKQEVLEIVQSKF